MSACVPRMVDEGKKQEQAVAACLNMWRNKEVDETVTFVQKLKEFFTMPKQEKIESPDSTFIVWKEVSGRYRWLSIYSNKWRDEDNPPEILAEAAHKEFVEAVDKGDWPLPEAWLWHVPGTKFGVADFVAYDDKGFALASGYVDEGKEGVAEFLMSQDDVFTSHGMPVKEIERDTEDSTIITRYRTSEISPLPREAAANKYGTEYRILKEVTMAVPENKKPWLEGALGQDGLKELEERLEAKAKELEQEGIEYKEEAPVEEVQEAAEEPAAEAVEDEEEAEPKEVAEEEPAEEPPQYVTADEVADAIGRYLKPMLDEMSASRQAIEEQGKELAELGKEVKSLQAEDEQKIKAALADTPAASLFDRIGSVIGSDETLIDGRSKLAKSGPEQESGSANGPTLVPGINEILRQQWGI